MLDVVGTGTDTPQNGLEGQVSISCPDGSSATGGGGQITDQEAGYVVGSGPELNGTTPVGWTIYYYPYVTNNVPYEIHVECIS
jgi:hypothetical protein